MYANGTGVEQSFTSAREWIQKAAAQGYELAIAALKRLDEHLRKTTTIKACTTWFAFRFLFLT